MAWAKPHVKLLNCSGSIRQPAVEFRSMKPPISPSLSSSHCALGICNLIGRLRAYLTILLQHNQHAIVSWWHVLYKQIVYYQHVTKILLTIFISFPFRAIKL